MISTKNPKIPWFNRAAKSLSANGKGIKRDKFVSTGGHRRVDL